MTLFIFFAAAAGAGIVAAYLVALDHLLVSGGTAVAAHELQLSHFLFFLTLDILGEILDRGLGCLPLPLLFGFELRCVVLFLLLVFVAGERQYRGRGFRPARDLQE